MLQFMQFPISNFEYRDKPNPSPIRDPLPEHVDQIYILDDQTCQQVPIVFVLGGRPNLRAAKKPKPWLLLSNEISIRKDLHKIRNENGEPNQTIKHDGKPDVWPQTACRPRS